jgi:prepilin-type N-terminal cleavage/methylation domain-containing protein
MKKMQKGFTLIELMVVVVIIGILAAVAVPKMFGMSTKAKVSEIPQTLAAFERLQEVYVSETGAAGSTAQIGFTSPTSKFAKYAFALGQGNGGLEAETNVGDGACGGGAALGWQTVVPADGNAATRSFTDEACSTLTPNWVVEADDD